MSLVPEEGDPRQKTIKKEVAFSGTGVHSGEEVSIRLKPSPPESGIVFFRRDLKGSPSVKASLENVTSTERESSLCQNGVEVRTIEHLLAALSALGIDNVFADLYGPEFPIGDGSSLPFVKMITEAGVEIQERRKKILSPKEPIWVSQEDRHIIAFPAENLKIDFLIDFKHPFLGIQRGSFEITEEVFIKEIAPARTFGFLRDAEFLWRNGHALGASLENTVVISERGILNDDLRFKDEFIRHKVLDVIGNISLLGALPNVHIVAVKAGHTLNIELAREISKLS